jgi:hypothetical protein
MFCSWRGGKDTGGQLTIIFMSKLAKLMIAGAGHLSGFDGVYDFETIGG